MCWNRLFIDIIKIRTHLILGLGREVWHVIHCFGFNLVFFGFCLNYVFKFKLNIRIIQIVYLNYWFGFLNEVEGFGFEEAGVFSSGNIVGHVE